MFKNRSIQMSVVKTPKHQQTVGDVEETKPFMTKDEAHAIAKDVINRIPVAIITVLFASKAIDTVSQIIIQKASQTRDN